MNLRGIVNQALGSRRKGRPAGGHGHAGTGHASGSRGQDEAIGRGVRKILGKLR